MKLKNKNFPDAMWSNFYVNVITPSLNLNCYNQLGI